MTGTSLSKKITGMQTVLLTIIKMKITVENENETALQ